MFSGTDSLFDIGRRNVEAVKAELQKLKIPLRADDTGGNRGRSIMFYLEDGRLEIKTIGQKPVECKWRLNETKIWRVFFALFLSWVLLVAYLIWGFWRNLSFLTLVWRFLLFSVTYIVIFYYSLWIISLGGNKEMEIRDESDSRD